MMNYFKFLLFVIVSLQFGSEALAEVIPGLEVSGAAEFSEHIYLEQNWTQKEREQFYYLTQGSQLLPYDFFLHLEQADSSELFRSDSNMLRLGYLPEKSSKANPDGLAIGLTRSGDHLGLTCSACHTQLLKYKEKYIRIDGGQAMLDLPKMRYELMLAIKETLQDSEKYLRFEKAILGQDNRNISAKDKKHLKQTLEREYEMHERFAHRNDTATLAGYSRLDAFGSILNKGLLLTGVEDNYISPNAPTSYPYLWDTPQHDYVEWNGSQSNSYIGALARNIGEAIGVFSQVIPRPTKRFLFFDAGYESSIETKNLRKLEALVSKLQSPLWPEFFPEIDHIKVKKGRKLYKKYCIGCHTDIDRTDPERLIKVRMSSLAYINTDPLMARNAITHKGRTGVLQGEPRFYSVGQALQEEAPALYIVNNLMLGVIKNNPLQSYLAIQDAKKLGHTEEIHPAKYVDGALIEKGQEVSEHALLAYKARPLNGIWTGAPFLHNGAVPNLYELLLPAEERSEKFYIGSWEFDSDKVGYIVKKTEGAFLLDTTIPGNANTGHEYGTGKDGQERLSEEQIWALIEYIKTL